MFRKLSLQKLFDSCKSFFRKLSLQIEIFTTYIEKVGNCLGIKIVFKLFLIEIENVNL